MKFAGKLEFFRHWALTRVWTSRTGRLMKKYRIQSESLFNRLEWSGQVQTLVVDLGSGLVKGGYGGDDAPRTVFPTVVARAKDKDISELDGREYWFGSDAVGHRKEFLSLSNPVERGVVTDWDEMEKLWHYIFFHELRTCTNSPVLLAEPQINPSEKREKMMELLLETFGIPATFVALQGSLALCSTGKTAGLVIDIGDSICNAIPIYEDRALNHAVCYSDVAGRDLTNYMSSLLNERGESVSNEKCNELKERGGTYVALDFEEELKISPANLEKTNEYRYDKNNSSNTISTERFKCPEALFRPSLVGKVDSIGIPEMAYNAIMKCHHDIRREFYSNIILCGGSSKFDGIADRMLREIVNLASSATRCKVIAPTERAFSTWLGGSIMSTLPNFEQSCIYREQHEEVGSSIIHTIVL